MKVARSDHRFPIDLEIPKTIRRSNPESGFSLGVRFHHPMLRPWVSPRMFGNLLTEADIGERVKLRFAMKRPQSCDCALPELVLN
jgi:hypothetical protein